MYLATARTLASTGAIWAIIIVAVVCLAFWLIMVVGIAPRPDRRLGPRTRSRAIDLESAARANPLGPATADGEPARQPNAEPDVTRDDLVPVTGVPGPRGAAPARPGQAPPAARPPAQRRADADEGAPSARKREG